MFHMNVDVASLETKLRFWEKRQCEDGGYKTGTGSQIPLQLKMRVPLTNHERQALGLWIRLIYYTLSRLRVNKPGTCAQKRLPLVTFLCRSLSRDLIRVADSTCVAFAKQHSLRAIKLNLLYQYSSSRLTERQREIRLASSKSFPLLTLHRHIHVATVVYLTNELNAIGHS